VYGLHSQVVHTPQSLLKILNFEDYILISLMSSESRMCVNWMDLVCSFLSQGVHTPQSLVEIFKFKIYF
jgi:hypothetical protein